MHNVQVLYALLTLSGHFLSKFLGNFQKSLPKIQNFSVWHKLQGNYEYFVGHFLATFFVSVTHKMEKKQLTRKEIKYKNANVPD